MRLLRQESHSFDADVKGGSGDFVEQEDDLDTDPDEDAVLQGPEQAREEGGEARYEIQL